MLSFRNGGQQFLYRQYEALVECQIANSKADTSIAEIQDRAEVNPMYLKRELFSFEVYGILFLERLIGMI
ncbi:MAG: hypothetical protein AAGU32_17055 [Bacillota bacterium]